MLNAYVQVGDFNLSRYMALDASFVKSSLEINPRWQAPEVIGEGYYSTAGTTGPSSWLNLLYAYSFC